LLGGGKRYELIYARWIEKSTAGGNSRVKPASKKGWVVERMANQATYLRTGVSTTPGKEYQCGGEKNGTLSIKKREKRGAGNAMTHRYGGRNIEKRRQRSGRQSGEMPASLGGEEEGGRQSQDILFAAVNPTKRKSLKGGTGGAGGG